MSLISGIIKKVLGLILEVLICPLVLCAALALLLTIIVQLFSLGFNRAEKIAP